MPGRRSNTYASYEAHHEQHRRPESALVAVVAVEADLVALPDHVFGEHADAGAPDPGQVLQRHCGRAGRCGRRHDAAARGPLRVRRGRHGPLPLRCNRGDGSGIGDLLAQLADFALEVADLGEQPVHVAAGGQVQRVEEPAGPLLARAASSRWTRRTRATSVVKSSLRTNSFRRVPTVASNRSNSFFHAGDSPLRPCLALGDTTLLWEPTHMAISDRLRAAAGFARDLGIHSSDPTGSPAAAHRRPVGFGSPGSFAAAAGRYPRTAIIDDDGSLATPSCGERAGGWRRTCTRSARDRGRRLE